MSDAACTKKKPRRVKGCYNCSQRRINCDRGSPCQKCLKKGLECLGLGVRYRFNKGVASRGKLAGRRIPVPASSESDSDVPSSRAENQNNEIPSIKLDIFDDILNQTVEDYPLPKTKNTFALHVEHLRSPPDLATSLENLDGESRFLLSYFSDSIAPAMVAINFIFNGYRDMILPISVQDATVRNAIMAASASHLALQHGQWKHTAAKYHIAAIQGLNRRAAVQSVREDESVQTSSLCTMVILLIEEMIVVGSDFHLLLDMVNNFVESQGGPGTVAKQPLGKFLIQQIRKMFLYALPFRSENVATQVLPAVGREDLDFIYSCLEIHPEYSEIICKLADIIQRASQIYSARARNLPEDIIAGLVQDFLTETATFNAASPGGHILIWPFFIVGTECRSPANQKFVESQLQALWNYTGFGNTLYAIKILKDIWQSGFTAKSKSHLFNRVEGFIM